MVLNFKFDDLLGTGKSEDMEFPVIPTLYTLNIIGATWHLILFTAVCIISTQDALSIQFIQGAFTVIFAVLVLIRKPLGIKSNKVFYIGTIGSAVIVFFLGIILASEFNNENILPIALSTSHSGASLIGQLNTKTCNGTEYSDFRKWMDCIRDDNSCATDACAVYSADPSQYIVLKNDTENVPKFVLRKGTTDVFSDGMYVWWGVALFTIITATFHYILAASADDYGNIIEKETYLEQTIAIMPRNEWPLAVPYIQWINNGIQPMRWAEYSITASLMIVLVFIINGVTDIYLLAFSYIIMNLINSFGAAIDYTKSAQIVAWFWACGIGAMIWLFALLLAAYNENIMPYMDSETKDLWQQYFGFIPWLDWIIIVLFSGFGITNIVHQYYRFNGCCKRIKDEKPTWDKECCKLCITRDVIEDTEQATLMFQIEIAYLIQSLVSKTLLCVLVMAGSVQRL